MTKYVQPILTKTPAQQILDLKEQNRRLIVSLNEAEHYHKSTLIEIDSLRNVLQATEGERDMLRGQNEELSRLLGLVRQDCFAYATLLRRAKTELSPKLSTEIETALGEKELQKE